MRAWSAILLVLFVVGAVLAAVGDGAADAIAIALCGIAAVGAVSLVFFAVGRSEDVARAAEEARRMPPDGPEDGDGRITARRPPRSRGDA